MTYARVSAIGIVCTLVALALTAAPRDARAADAPATQPAVRTVRIKALVNGRSRLHLRGDTAYWTHLEFDAPGRHDDGGGNGPTEIDGKEWLPDWPDDPDPHNGFCGCASSPYVALDPPIPQADLDVKLTKLAGRSRAILLQPPTRENHFTTTIELDDLTENGPETFKVELAFAPATRPAAAAVAPATAPADPRALRRGLVLHLPFEDGKATDASGLGHVAVVDGATPTEDRAGKANGAMAFDGTADYIVIDPPPKLGTGGLTVSAWIKLIADAAPAPGWNSAIVCQDDGNDNDPSRRIFQLSLLGRNLMWHRAMQSTDPAAVELLRPGQWTHVVATFDGREHRLYVDARLNDTRPGTLRASADEPIYIGRKGSDEPTFFFHGAIDDVRVYDRALDEKEVAALHEAKRLKVE
jgi:hypothetical protein